VFTAIIRSASILYAMPVVDLLLLVTGLSFGNALSPGKCIQRYFLPGKINPNDKLFYRLDK